MTTQEAIQKAKLVKAEMSKYPTLEQKVNVWMKFFPTPKEHFEYSDALKQVPKVANDLKQAGIKTTPQQELVYKQQMNNPILYRQQVTQLVKNFMKQGI